MARRCSTPASTTPQPSAMTRLAPGPASATITMAQRGLRSALSRDRHRFRPSEQQPAHGQQDARNQHGADRIEVAQRIQAEAPQKLGGAVPEVPCGPAMSDFMQGDREKHWNCIDRNFAKKIR